MPKLDETDNLLADMLAEPPPLNAQLSSGLILPASGSTGNSLTNGVDFLDLYKRATIGDNQDTAMTLTNDYHDSTWTSDKERDGSNSLLNTTDPCNVFDMCAFSWPPTGMEPACNFAFDMPLTAQQTDLPMGVLSTALAKNDATLLSSGSCATNTSPESSRTMIGMSNLKGKEEAPAETAVVLMPDIEPKDAMRSFLGKKEKIVCIRHVLIGPIRRCYSQRKLLSEGHIFPAESMASRDEQLQTKRDTSYI
jgi:hypothetical protein